MSRLKIGTRSKLLTAALGLLVVTGCVPVGYYDQPVGYYDPCPYGCGGGAVVLNYNSYNRPHGHPGYHGGNHWRGRGH